MYPAMAWAWLDRGSPSSVRTRQSHSVLPSIYFEQKIKRLEKKETSFKKNRDLIKTKIEYSYGVILEHNDRIIENDYYLQLKIIKKPIASLKKYNNCV